MGREGFAWGPHQDGSHTGVVAGEGGDLVKSILLTSACFRGVKPMGDGYGGKRDGYGNHYSGKASWMVDQRIFASLEFVIIYVGDGRILLLHAPHLLLSSSCKREFVCGSKN